jgi:hypothetical protein
LENGVFRVATGSSGGVGELIGALISGGGPIRPDS